MLNQWLNFPSNLPIFLIYQDIHAAIIPWTVHARFGIIDSEDIDIFEKERYLSTKHPKKQGQPLDWWAAALCYIEGGREHRLPKSISHLAGAQVKQNAYPSWINETPETYPHVGRSEKQLVSCTSGAPPKEGKKWGIKRENVCRKIVRPFRGHSALWYTPSNQQVDNPTLRKSYPVLLLEDAWPNWYKSRKPWAVVFLCARQAVSGSFLFWQALLLRWI